MSSLEDKVRLQLKKGKHPFFIDPRTSKRIGYWDALTSLALVYTALVTPAEVALAEAATSPFEPLFLINRCLDGIFIIDLFVQFRLMTEVYTSEDGGGTVWLTSSWGIAKNYLKGWFGLDVTSILVSFFDFVSLPPVKAVLAGSSSGENASSSSLSSLKVLRVLRVLRLVKLARLIRASRMMKRWETRMAINYAVLSLLKACVMLILMGHWMACVWVLQAKVQADMANTWLGRLEYCDMPGPGETTEPFCPPLRVYAGGLYYAAATITSIGYGDITPTHHNEVETLVAVTLMFSSCVSWAHLIGVFSGVLSNFDPEKNEFRDVMDSLNRFIAREGFAKELAQRMREYFHQSKHLRAAKMQQELMSNLPPTLQGEVSWKTNQTWLSKIPFLRNAEQEFMLELSLMLHAVVFSPSDVAPRGYLFIVQRGIMMYRGKILTKGKIWGEDMVLSTDEYRSKAPARAMNYVAAYYITRTELFMLADKYPETRKGIRLFAFKLALAREVVVLARAIRAKHEENGGGGQLDGNTAIALLRETIEGGLEAKRLGMKLEPMDPNENPSGELQGYSGDMKVQFGLLTQRLDEIQQTFTAAMKVQSEAIASLRPRAGLTLQRSYYSVHDTNEDRVQDGERAIEKDRPTHYRRQKSKSRHRDRANNAVHGVGMGAVIPGVLMANGQEAQITNGDAHGSPLDPRLEA